MRFDLSDEEWAIIDPVAIEETGSCAGGWPSSFEQDFLHSKNQCAAEIASSSFLWQCPERTHPLQRKYSVIGWEKMGAKY